MGVDHIYSLYFLHSLALECKVSAYADGEGKTSCHRSGAPAARPCGALRQTPLPLLLTIPTHPSYNKLYGTTSEAGESQRSAV